MKTPKTTEEKPYIEFKFYDDGKLKLSTSNDWWGGLNSGFIGYGFSGNTCLPKDLEKYIKRFKEKKIKELDLEIKKLEKRKEKLILKFEL